jgi:hypothetical protein
VVKHGGVTNPWIFLQQRTDDIFIAIEQKPDVRMTDKRNLRAGDHNLGSVVAPHDIK